MKRKLVFVMMLLVFAAGVVKPADARQPVNAERRHNKSDEAAAPGGGKPSRKEQKRHRKELKKKEKQERKKQRQEKRSAKKHRSADDRDQETATAPAENTTKTEDYPLTKMKPRYRIDVLAAMYLDELVKGQSVTYKNKMPEKAEQGIAFYEGVQMAADSLKKAGFKIDIYIHDISSASESVDKLLAGNMLDSSDLVIGAVEPRLVPQLAAFAKQKQINFVSATTPYDDVIKRNAFVTLMQPTLKSHCEWISDNISVKFGNANVAMLYRSTNDGDVQAYNYITANKNARYTQFSCNTLPGKNMLSVLFDTTKPNVVVIPVTDLAYADSLLTLLSRYFPSTHFDVFGMPNWTAIPGLRKSGRFPNLTVNLTIPFYVGPYSPVGKYVARLYKRDYGGKAPDAVYQGFEALFWYANLLKDYGTIFNVKYEDNTKAPFTSFDIRPRTDKKGNINCYENKHVFLMRYEAGISKAE